MNVSDYMTLIAHRNRLAEDLRKAVARYRSCLYPAVRHRLQVEIDRMTKDLDGTDRLIDALAPGKPGVLVGQC